LRGAAPCSRGASVPGEGPAEAGAGRGRGVYEQLIGALQLPPECAAKGRALGGLFASGERHLLPSFFNLLRHMHAQARARPLPRRPPTLLLQPAAAHACAGARAYPPRGPHAGRGALPGVAGVPGRAEKTGAFLQDEIACLI